MHIEFPLWTALPFVMLVLSIAIFPGTIPQLWEKNWFSGAIVGAISLPVIVWMFTHGASGEIGGTMSSFATFIVTIGALYITTHGIIIDGDILATPKNNTIFLVIAAILASVVGTTGASMLLIRPFLDTNSERRRTKHLIVFFIIFAANMGGLLTPLGNPPLLVGYLEGVPFFWPLRLYWVWLLYVISLGTIFYFVDRHQYRKELASDLEQDVRHVRPLAMRGTMNIIAVVVVCLGTQLPAVLREIVIVLAAVWSLVATPKKVHEDAEYSITPLVDVAIVFAGLFICLPPIEAILFQHAEQLPLHHPWQLFWASGLLSSVLDNAPTYAAFLAVARGLSHGAPNLVAGARYDMLVAISAGSVIMGATTYIGNGPNLLVKAIADKKKMPTPHFFQYALWAICIMFPVHFVMTLILWATE